MDINEILDMLGLDLTNPEVKRGAVDAINAILSSRIPPASMSGGVTSGEVEVEIDPDLLQPSIKHQSGETDDDVEIEDEENVLDSVEHNESEDDFEGNTSGDDASGDSESSSGSNDANSDTTQSDDSETSDSDGGGGSSSSNDDVENSEEDAHEPGDDAKSGEAKDNEQDDETDSDESSKNSEGEFETEDSGDNTEEESDDDFDETDFVDDNLKGSYEDKELSAKQEARRIKRERTILAAKRALDDAKSRKVNQSLIRELEKSIEALENLSEAVTKSLKDLSDEEFDLMVNRVLDAIDAVGNSELSVKTAQEKELQAKEIKKDLGSAKTQNELSAEDAAKIRQETQAIKAREKEKDKYKTRDASSFKGFRDFLNSLYRAVAMQVKVNEVQDDSWSALSRRNVGAGVLRQGKRINELPDSKIPVIDFYFDCSGSWGPKDIKIGKKAVESLVEMEEKGQIKINLYYFGDRVSTDPTGTGGGTSGWNEIVKNVIATQATNVIVMTDSDMEDWWQGPEALKYTVPGYVWYLWRDGINAPRLPRDLKGRGGTQQFSFSHSDI